MLENNIITGLEKISQIDRLLNWGISIDKGLSPIQNQFLKFISENPVENNTVSNLAMEFNLKKSTVSDSIKVLLNKKLLIKIKEKEDKRFFFLKTSKIAKEYLSLINNKQGLLMSVISEFSIEEKKAANIFFMKFIKSLFDKGYINKVKMCLTCDNFTKNKLQGDQTKQFCSFLNTSISNEDLKFNCPSYTYTS